MREQQEKTVDLPEDDPEAFAVFVNWLYAEKITDDADAECLINAYTLADKFLMPELGNAVVDNFRRKMQRGLVNPEWVQNVWNKTIEGCQLRKLAIDQLHYALVEATSSYKKNVDGVSDRYAQMEGLMKNGELGLVLVLRLAGQMKSPPKDPSKLTGCVYHVHKDGKQCKS